MSRKKKNTKNDPKFEKLILWLKKGVPILVITCCICILILGVRAIFFSIPYFRISSIEVSGIDDSFHGFDQLEHSSMLTMNVGKHIFSVDIKALADSIKMTYPEVREAVVNRVMPDRLEVKVKLRIPIAVIKAFGKYPIDSEGVILSPDIRFNGTLPVISGISMWTRPAIGENIKSVRSEKAIKLLTVAMRSKTIKSFGIEGIDVSNVRNLLLFLDHGPEVRLGDDEIPEKLKQLEDILRDKNIDKDNLRYIDLRFKEVVLGPK